MENGEKKTHYLIYFNVSGVVIESVRGDIASQDDITAVVLHARNPWRLANDVRK